MYQAWVTRVVAAAATASRSRRRSRQRAGQNSRHYVMEIVVERGPFLSVPNEAIIEEGDRRVVYVQQQPGQYVPQEIQTGIQGELYTAGRSTASSDGDQVVTFGSFFIDAEHKLKGPTQARDQHADDHRRH